MTTRKCVSGVVSATLATIVLTGASWAEDVRPPAVGTAPAKTPSSLALPHHVTGQVVSVNKPAKLFTLKTADRSPTRTVRDRASPRRLPRLKLAMLAQSPEGDEPPSRGCPFGLYFPRPFFRSSCSISLAVHSPRSPRVTVTRTLDPTGTSWVERSGGYSTAPRHGIFTRSLLDRDSLPVHRDLHGGALAADV